MNWHNKIKTSSFEDVQAEIFSRLNTLAITALAEDSDYKQPSLQGLIDAHLKVLQSRQKITDARKKAQAEADKKTPEDKTK